MGYPSMPDERPTPQPKAEDIPLPAPRLTVPSVPEKQFPIRHTDWLHLRRKIANLSDPPTNLANLGWSCAGIAASAMSSYFPWVAADSQLPIRAQQHYAYIAPLLLIISVASSVLAIFSFFVNSKMVKMRTASVKDVLADMDSIYKPHLEQAAQAADPVDPIRPRSRMLGKRVGNLLKAGL